MENLVSEILLFLLTAIPFILLIAGLIGLMYLRQLKRRYGTHIRFIGSQLRGIDRDLSVIRFNTQHFKPVEPEPYGSLATQLAEALVQIEVEQRHLFGLYKDLQEKLTQFNQKDIRIAPLIQRLYSQINILFVNLDAGIERQTKRLQNVNGLEVRLANAGWEIAQTCQHVLNDIQVAIQNISNIHQQGFRDENSEAVLLQLSRWENTIHSQIPAVFFSNEKAMFEERADRETIVRVNKSIQPVLDESTKIKTLADDWHLNLVRYTELVEKLTKCDVEINNFIENVDKESKFRLDWDQNGDAIMNLSEEIRREGIADTGISTLHTHNRRLNSLSVHQDNLLRHITEIVGMHQGLKQVLENGKILQISTWLDKSATVISEASQYHPDNWRPTYEIADLEHQLSSLSSKTQELSVKINVSPILESEISAVYKLSTLTNHEFEGLLSKIKDLNSRLLIVRNLETESKENLAGLRSVFNQLDSIVSSNPLLKRKYSKQLDRLKSDLNDIVLEFDNRGIGIIEEKRQRLNKFIQRCEQSLNQWDESLNDSIQERKNNLAKTVNVLQDLVLLSDPIFVEVVNLLQDQTAQVSSLSPSSLRTPLLSSVQKLKSKSEEWQRIISSTQAVEEMSGPILNEFKKLERSRDSLVENMKRADRLVPEDLSWPPTTQRLSLEREQFKSLENQFRDFKKTRRKAIQLVSIISDLSDQFRELDGIVSRVLDKASQEHQQFAVLEKRLHQSKSMWNDRLLENTANPTLVTEIENLLERSERDFIELQKRVMNGSLPYQQAYQMFRRLNKELDNASLQAEGNQIIDITGSLHRQL